MNFNYDSRNRRNKEPSAAPSSEGLEGCRLTAPQELFIYFGTERICAKPASEQDYSTLNPQPQI